MKRAFLFFLLSVILLIAVEVLSVYFIMPFPGSQLGLNANSASLDRVKIAYWLHQNGVWLRTIGLILMAYPAFLLVTHEFFGMATVLPEAKQAQALAADDLKQALK